MSQLTEKKGIDPSAMFKISYGLYVLTANDQSKDNGCIINTTIQITDTPKRIAIAVNKNNLTHDIILKTGVFNVSVLTQKTPFAVFEHFGFVSGRNADKFADYENIAKSENGLPYLTEYSNGFISARVTSTQDLDTHTLFIAEVTEAQVLSDAPSLTYDYYFEHIKPKPAPKARGYVCKICGYVYDGETLPPDYVCPLCGHGADDFEPLV